MKSDDYLFCHNCNRSWSPLFWIKEACNMTFSEIVAELRDSHYDPEFRIMDTTVNEKSFDIPVLPGECVNLRDDLQVAHFSYYPAVAIARDYCGRRRLFTATYAPKNLFCCVDDRYHGNRLIIPCYKDGIIVNYISRKLLNSDTKAKYLTKFGSKKPVFNLDKVDVNFPYIFIFEGQIDSMFVKNGIAISGVYLTSDQEFQLMQQFPFHKRVWMMDNYRLEGAEVTTIIVNKAKSGESLFLFDGDFAKYKDINEYCVASGIDCVDPERILNSVYTGDRALFKIGE